MWPLSLLALRQVTNTLQINRNHEDPGSVISCDFNKSKAHNNNHDEKLGAHSKDARDNLYPKDNKFNNLFTKHIKKKKRYEIQEIAQVMH